jgi:riboflavin synthase
MFTGIVEATGALKSIEIRGSSAKMSVETTLDLSCVNLGDSIAVDGACVTVTELGANSFVADLSSETLAATTLGGLRLGEKVNIESALTLGKPLGGHLVTGHVDCVGTLLRRVERGEFVQIEFALSDEFTGQIVKKGSITVDGISLTVAALTAAGFSISTIPFTLERTTLGAKRAGAKVNIETDIIGKYVEKQLGKGSAGKVTEGFLAEHGFID